MASKALKTDRDTSPFRQVLDDANDKNHPVVDDLLRWYLFAKCSHQEQNIEAGILNHARDCNKCLVDHHMAVIVMVRDILKPIADLDRKLQLP